MTTPLSSAPCTPAPGRRIIIIRCDNQLSPVNLFVSFDRVVPPAPPEKVTSHRRSGSADSTGSDGQPPKKRWGLLRSMFGTSSSRSVESTGSGNSSDDSDSGSADFTTSPNSRCLDDHEQTPSNSTEDVSRPKTPHQPFFFKFSLEWMDRPQWPTKNKRLFAPCLPVASQLHVQHRRSPAKPSEFETASEHLPSPEDTDNNTLEEPPKDPSEGASEGAPEDPPHVTPPEPVSEMQLRTPTTKDSPLPDLPAPPAFDHLVASKYAGRALAEWAHIVSECDSFFARRRDEGVPSDRTVETPNLGVESFRK